ncbi:MAG: ECF transporter S component [Lachnospiraceae bacterium]|nr:ECF transporter S component [Lachnospiraceae bacterium]
MNVKSKTQQLVGTAVLLALVIVLQVFASSIPWPFTFKPTFALIPVIIGAILYGPATGAFLGFAFGAVVTASVVSGADVGGAMMLAQNPIATVIICLGKSTVAGFVSGLVAHKLSSKNMTLSVVLAALLTPVCNTAIFIVGVLLCFLELIQSWAGGQALAEYVIFGLIGVNFLIEVLFDIILAPIIIRIITAIKKNSAQ